MKMPIAWHEQCLVNQHRHAKEQMEQALKELARAQKYEREASAYALQICEAKDRGLDGFDSERFGKKRKNP